MMQIVQIIAYITCQMSDVLPQKKQKKKTNHKFKSKPNFNYESFLRIIFSTFWYMNRLFKKKFFFLFFESKIFLKKRSRFIYQNVE